MIAEESANADSAGGGGFSAEMRVVIKSALR
jgi:hypothetical protein